VATRSPKILAITFSPPKSASVQDVVTLVEIRMLFRAVFWIGIVALLMPRESETRLAPGGSSPSSAMLTDAVPSADFQDVLLARFAAVREDIETAERARAVHGG
jgi:hypothetical protein